MLFSDLVLFGALIILLGVTGSKLACLWAAKRHPLGRRKHPLDTESFTNTYTENGSLIRPGDACYPVRYCSGRRFARPIRFFPWDAVGVLVVNDTQFRFLGKTTRGETLRIAFPRNDSFISYVEKMFWRDGGLSWFSIEAHGKKFFFSSEGTLPDLSKPDRSLTAANVDFSTTGIYEKMTERFSNL